MAHREEVGSSVQSPAAQVYAPNAILRWLYRRFFAHLTVDERWSAVVRDAANRGVVVYVMRSLSVLDFLCLDWLVKKFGLPLVRFVNDLGLWILEPFGKGGRRLRLRRQVPEDRALSDTVRERFSALLFLRRPPKIGQVPRKGREFEVDLIRTLVESQRQIDEPILLVPQTFVWSKLPPNKKRSLLDLFFGPTEWPGKIRVFFQFLLNYRNALLRSGDPFDLKRFLEENQDLTDARAADKIRYALLRRMEREREIVLGPGKKTPGRIRDELLRSPRVRRHIEQHARAEKMPVAKVEKLARKELKQLCAAQDPYWLGFLHRVFDRVWNRIYDGLEVDREGLERVREAARHGTLVLLPSHKSHVDYLVLSDVFYMNAMSPPLIAAGDNLSFWPLGPLLRRGGAFFIRRSFKGKRLYAALVDAYIRKLLVEGFSIEFFLEGGRSRTGKLLAPKFGLLSMVVDACLVLPGKRVFFVPISIGYERVIEERSYVDELSGADKQRENIGGLLKTPKVLRSKYGRLYVQFGEIIEFEDVLREIAGEVEDGRTRREVTPPQRRNLVQTIGHRVVYDIDRVTVVTPTALVATVVLAHRRRGITRSELLAGAQQMADALRRFGARFARTIFDEDGRVRPDTIEEAVHLFVDGKLMSVADDDGAEPIYSVPEERRIALEYYKNNILHFFVPSALIAAALHAKGGEPVSRHMLRERVRQLSRLFKYEFTYRTDADFDPTFDEALRHMLEAGEIEELADRVRPSEDRAGERLLGYATMLRTYFETYRLAIRGLELLAHGSMTRKEWLKRTLAVGQRMYLAGELELRESLSKARLENALQALRDHGVVRSADEDGLALSEEAGGLEGLRQLEQRIATSLARAAPASADVP